MLIIEGFLKWIVVVWIFVFEGDIASIYTKPFGRQIEHLIPFSLLPFA